MPNNKKGECEMDCDVGSKVSDDFVLSGKQKNLFGEEFNPEEEAAKQIERDQWKEEQENMVQDPLPGWKFVTFISSSAGRDKKTGKKRLRKNPKRIRLIGMYQKHFKFLDEEKDNIPGLDSLAEEILGEGCAREGNPVELLLEKFRLKERLEQK